MELIERDNLLALFATGFKTFCPGRVTVFLFWEKPALEKRLWKNFSERIEGKSIQFTGACDSLFHSTSVCTAITI